jgi:hypothetical protein
MECQTSSIKNEVKGAEAGIEMPEINGPLISDSNKE